MTEFAYPAEYDGGLTPGESNVDFSWYPAVSIVTELPLTHANFRQFQRYFGTPQRQAQRAG